MSFYVSQASPYQILPLPIVLSSNTHLFESINQNLENLKHTTNFYLSNMEDPLKIFQHPIKCIIVFYPG